MPTTTSRPFVLGGAVRLGFSGVSTVGRIALALLAVVLAFPIRGLYTATGSSMEEGFMLVFPNLVQDGRVPNVDFLHLYGPTSLDSLALWYRLFGDGLASERTFGLIQNLAIIAAIYALGRVAGHVAAVGAALVCAMLVMTPIGLVALAWHGGIALGLWATVFGARGRATGRFADWWVAGCLAGLALGFRPDLVLALSLTFGWLVWRRRRDLAIVAAGAFVGLLPMWWHLVRAGPVTAFRGMVLDPVIDLRPGRELPRPPSWGEIDGALQAVAENPAPRWWLPAPAASQQLFIWFWGVLIVAIGAAVVAAVRYRRSDPEARPDLVPLVAATLFGVGILPQALQRPDSAHLAWVSMVSWPLVVILAVEPLRRGVLHVRWRAATVATAVVGVVMLVVCPFYTYRMYAMHTRVSVGDLPAPHLIERNGHQFWVGDPTVAAAINEMLPDLDEITEPGDRLIVGPGDLSRTVYADTFIYWLFPELEPATHFIEMDPGLADAEDSGLAEDIAAADVVVLTNTWSGWVEANASTQHGSSEHNQAIADHHCLVESYHTNLVLLFRACEGGGGFDPSTVAGRSAEPGGGGISPAD